MASSVSVVACEEGTGEGAAAAAEAWREERREKGVGVTKG